MQFFAAVIVAAVLVSVDAFVSTRLATKASPRVGPVYENFGFKFAEDAVENTPRKLLGEANYKNFVESYDPEALLVGGPKYNVIERVRELKLLSLTAQSGLLEALEAKGLTLSQVEKLLPLVDNLGLLPLISKNKDTLLSLAPLVIEPAPALLPLVVSILRTSPTTFSSTGFAFIALGAFEIFENAGLVGAPLALLGLPLVALGSILSGNIPLPSAAAPVATINQLSTPSAGRPVARKRPAPPKVPATAKIVTIAGKPSSPSARAVVRVAAAKVAAAPNGPRKLVKVTASSFSKAAAPAPKVAPKPAAPKAAAPAPKPVAPKFVAKPAAPKPVAPKVAAKPAAPKAAAPAPKPAAPKFVAKPAAPKPAAPKAAAPKATSAPKVAAKSGGSLNGQRKTVKVN